MSATEIKFGGFGGQGVILAGMIIAKKGNIYKAASAGERGPKKCDEKATTKTLFT